MSPNLNVLDQLSNEIQPYGATLIAVSKKKAVTDILTVFHHGHHNFGENYVNELVDKHSQISESINWHFIGHLQTNKVKMIVPFVKLIHGIDSKRLLQEVNKQALKINRRVDVLLQVHIATEDTKFGLSTHECEELMNSFQEEDLPGVNIRGLMGMASLTDDEIIIRNEFKLLNKLFANLKINTAHNFDTLSMGMSNDYKIALDEGSTMIRIGSMIFGAR